MLGALLVGAALAADPEAEPTGTPAPYTAAVRFHRDSPPRELRCDDEACVYRGGAAGSASWLYSYRCSRTELAGHGSRIAFATVCQTESGRGHLDVGYEEDGVVTWRRTPMTGLTAIQSLQLAFSADGRWLWLHPRSHVPQMVVYDARVLSVPDLRRLPLVGHASRDEVAAADGARTLTTTWHGPSTPAAWRPSTTGEVLAFVETAGGCVGVWGLRPRGCTYRLRWSVEDQVHLEAWRVEHCYDRDVDGQTAWRALAPGGFETEGTLPSEWSWTGVEGSICGP